MARPARRPRPPLGVLSPPACGHLFSTLFQPFPDLSAALFPALTPSRHTFHPFSPVPSRVTTCPFPDPHLIPFPGLSRSLSRVPSGPFPRSFPRPSSHPFSRPFRSLSSLFPDPLFTSPSRPLSVTVPAILFSLPFLRPWPLLLRDLPFSHLLRCKKMNTYNPHKIKDILLSYQII